MAGTNSGVSTGGTTADNTAKAAVYHLDLTATIFGAGKTLIYAGVTLTEGQGGVAESNSVAQNAIAVANLLRASSLGADYAFSAQDGIVVITAKVPGVDPNRNKMMTPTTGTVDPIRPKAVQEGVGGTSGGTGSSTGAIHTNVNNTYSRADVMKALRLQIYNKYAAEDATLQKILDNNHHAYVMPTFGRDTKLLQVLLDLQQFLATYDTEYKTIEFDLNGGVGAVTPGKEGCIVFSFFTLPAVPSGITHPDPSKEFAGWGEHRDGSGRFWKAGQRVKITENFPPKLYALWARNFNYIDPSAQPDEI